MRAVTLALLGFVGLIGTVTYSYLKPASEPTAPIEAVALAQESSAAAGSEVGVFEIVPEESEARFVIDEALQGTPKTVVGATRQVSGQIALDPAERRSGPS